MEDDCVQGEHLWGFPLVSWWVMAEAVITQSGPGQPSAGGTPDSLPRSISVMNLSSGDLYCCGRVTLIRGMFHYSWFLSWLALLSLNFPSFSFLLSHFLSLSHFVKYFYLLWSHTLPLPLPPIKTTVVSIIRRQDSIFWDGVYTGQFTDLPAIDRSSFFFYILPRCRESGRQRKTDKYVNT